MLRGLADAIFILGDPLGLLALGLLAVPILRWLQIGKRGPIIVNAHCNCQITASRSRAQPQYPKHSKK